MSGWDDCISYNAEMIQRFSYISGALFALLLAILAQGLASLSGFSAAVLALLTGMFISSCLRVTGVWVSCLQSDGLTWCEKQGLGWAIALMGLQMPWAALQGSGAQVLVLVCAGLVFTFSASFLLSRWFQLSQDQSMLMATGNGICGSAAVMATQSIIHANRSDTAMVVTLVNLLGLLGIVVTPLMVWHWFPGQVMHAGQLIGNTLQSMPHVVAAGFAVNDDVAQTAVWVKMIRILMLMPVLFLLAWWHSKQKPQHQLNPISKKRLPWLALVPVFIWGFMSLALLNLVITLPALLLAWIERLSDLLMCMALVAIGAHIQWQEMRRSGGKILLMGVLLFGLQLVFSVLLIANL